MRARRLAIALVAMAVASAVIAAGCARSGHRTAVDTPAGESPAVPGATATAPSAPGTARDIAPAFAVEAGGATYRVDIASAATAEIIRFPPAIAAHPDAAAIYHQYAVSSDGRLLAVACDDAGMPRPGAGYMNVCLFDSERVPGRIVASRTSLVRQGRIGRPYYLGDPFTFSPDAKSLVVFASVDDDTDDVYLADVQAGVMRRLIENNDGGHWSTPIWSPDSRRFAIRRLIPNSSLSRELLVIDAATGAQVDVARGVRPSVRVANSVAWSPDSASIAFVAGEVPLDSPAPQDLRLYVAPAAGSPVVEIATGGHEPASDAAVRWSPDARWVAVTLVERPASTATPAQAQTYALRVDGSVQRALGAAGEAAWSPDGAAIAIWAVQHRRYVVVIAHLDGSPQASFDVATASLGGVTVYNTFFGWSVAGQRIYYILTGCGQGGCTVGPLRVADLNSSAGPRDVTASGARFLGYLAGADD